MAKKIKTHGISSFFHYKTLYICAGEAEDYKKGDVVVFTDSEGNNEIGIIIVANVMANEDDVVAGSGVLRKATDHDTQKMNANKETAKNAKETCIKLIDNLKLNMHLIDVVYSLDGGKVNFIFTSDERVDFRELVKDLAKKLQKQIHLQQIGPRDKSRFIRGFGKCGRKLCCQQAVGKLKSITMDMVRVQGMSNKGSEKLSGVCGKLMCCLAYESGEYEELGKKIPPFNSTVTLKNGSKGRLRGADILNQNIRLDNDGEVIMAKVDDIKKVEPYKKREKKVTE